MAVGAFTLSLALASRMSRLKRPKRPSDASLTNGLSDRPAAGVN